MLERRVKDPRLGFVTVTEARLTGDLREATVYYTVYGTAEEQADTAAALASATGVIRSEVGRQTGLRHTPSLTFVRDTLPEGAPHMEDLVARARAADAGLAGAREGAPPPVTPTPTGEPPEDAETTRRVTSCAAAQDQQECSSSSDWPGRRWVCLACQSGGRGRARLDAGPGARAAARERYVASFGDQPFEVRRSSASCPARPARPRRPTRTARS